mmetsp:Transcript_120260/g.340782  ORF Transcript_120260/g.340782 Transcript_120260/m.340782 type:complete len:238 (-) Transcript_120260:102-815(-)
MVGHADEAGAIVQDVEGLVPEVAPLGRLGVEPRAIHEVASLHPAAGLHPVHWVAVELRMRQEVAEVLREHRAFLVEELDVDDLLRVFIDGDGQRTIRSARSGLHRLQAFVADSLVKDQSGVVLVLEALVGPVKEALLIQEVQGRVFRLRENDGHAGLRLHEAAAVLVDDEPNLLLRLRFEVALHGGLYEAPVAREELRGDLVHLEQGVLDLPVHVDVVLGLRDGRALVHGGPHRSSR